jgi:hypothetical protein
MNKKQLKEWLQKQIYLAIYNKKGDYTITNKGVYIFELPEDGTKYHVNCAIHPNDYKNSRLHEFYKSLDRSPTFKNTRHSPKL